jgi:hypothetical protein
MRHSRQVLRNGVIVMWEPSEGQMPLTRAFECKLLSYDV